LKERRRGQTQTTRAGEAANRPELSTNYNYCDINGLSVIPVVSTHIVNIT